MIMILMMVMTVMMKDMMLDHQLGEDEDDDDDDEAGVDHDGSMSLLLVCYKKCQVSGLVLHMRIVKG